MKNINELIDNAQFESKNINCKGCDNNCLVVRYRFNDNKVYYSGNRCEKVFANEGTRKAKGKDAYAEKLHNLFDRAQNHVSDARIKIGIPRVLNMFEDFPFWHTLLTQCKIDVILSLPSDMRGFEASANKVMSDNICFPAKLVYSHVNDLVSQKVDRIFFPFVIHGPKGKDQNSYNCPIVTGYSQVLHDCPIPLDSPVISMKDNDLFRKQCVKYLATLGIDKRTAKAAFDQAKAEQQQFERQMVEANQAILNGNGDNLCIMLAGRPYHSDPLIQHQVSDMIASLGVNVITDDLVRTVDSGLDDVEFLAQWSYTNRILRAAKWCGEQDSNVQFVEFTSFGCGPDAFMTDAVRDLLARYGKSLTLLKLDDISNIGSMRLRVRSLIDSLAIANSAGNAKKEVKPFETTPAFQKEDKRRTIIVPFFTPFVSPLIPSVLKNQGYTFVCLPESSQETADIGLKYANNEVCYPATLVVGDIVAAIQKGGYDTSNLAVAMTQTGGQCRASNYLSLIKKALVDAGYGDIPVISVNFDSELQNDQPGFEPNWFKLIPAGVYGVLFSDCLAKLYYPTKVREKQEGVADALKDKYLKQAADLLEKDSASKLLPLIRQAAHDFNEAADDSEHKKAGIVGEIYLKFNPFAHHNIPNWLMQHGVEIAPPILTDFFIQYFVNRKTNEKSYVEKSSIPDWVVDIVYKLFEHYVGKFNKACKAFRYYTPFNDIFKEAENASEIITLSTQFGEGWLLPGEIATYYKNGVKNVLSLQPFGCIANHIVVRGVEKKIKRLFPDLNLLAIDFDGGVSEVNITNRLLLFLDNLK